MPVSTHHRINKVLIANRGEIALRVQRACQALSLPSAITISEADKDTYFARKATETVPLKGSSARDTYLNIDKIIQAAKDCGANSVHPGYGFLSENAEFAKRSLKAGLIFIGPRPECIEILGNKTEARRRVALNGVPCTPGTEAGLSEDILAKAASKIGYPVIIKAAAGGGGRGMRIVYNKTELLQALPLAKGEALKNFSDERVYIEKYIERPRHIEVQIFGDNHSNVVHFGTRECSVQRRHQKLIEEAPAIGISAALRKDIQSAAVRAAASVAYNNAGTAEFLVKDNKFYFLEMNTRIQVEHPVTEEVCGVDLVTLQIKIANNEKLPFSQREIKQEGHAIEFRIYAEKPLDKFSPSIGKITALSSPKADFFREERAYESGDTITPYYDAMISKLIVKGADKNQAIERSKKILKEYNISGIENNIDFHLWAIAQKEFQQSTLDIAFVERDFSEQAMKSFLASQVLDPYHRAAQEGAEYKERLSYYSERYLTDYEIEVIHRQNGTFALIPLNNKGKKAKPKYCRASNGLRCALDSLISEVLEAKPPKEIF